MSEKSIYPVWISREAQINLAINQLEYNVSLSELRIKANKEILEILKKEKKTLGVKE